MVVPGDGRGRGQGPDAASARVDLDLRGAGRAVQLALVARFHPALADEIGALVVRGQAIRLEVLQVAVADAADVAERVRRGLAEG